VPTGGGLCHSGLAEWAHGQGMAWRGCCVCLARRGFVFGEIPVAHILWGELSDGPALGNPEEIEGRWILVWILHVGGFVLLCRPTLVWLLGPLKAQRRVH
jgi:hypothetical protein